MTTPEKWILGIETSGPGTQVALWSPTSGQEYTRRHEAAFEHAEVLNRLVDEVLNDVGVPFSDLTALAVSQGPGYFTALRVGISYAKAFALATQKPIKAVPTLRALAYDAPSSCSLVVPVLNAQKQQVYVAVYKREGNHFHEVWPPRVMDPEDVVVQWRTHSPCFVGQGVTTYPAAFRDVQVYPEVRYPQALTIAKLGWYALEKEGPDDPLRVEPLYIRLPDAVVHARKRRHHDSDGSA